MFSYFPFIFNKYNNMNNDDFKNIISYDNFIKNIHKNRIEMYKNYKKSINDIDFKIGFY